MIWSGSVVPDADDNVIIASGTNVNIQDGDVTVNDLSVNTGGVLDAENNRLTVNGNLVVDGTHNGPAAIGSKLSLPGANTGISGQGNITGGLSIPSGNKNINATSLLIISDDIEIGAGVSVYNHGDISLDGSINGADVTSTWVNSDNSILHITGELLLNGALHAYADGNIVDYNGAGQIVKEPFISVYHDLNTGGSGIKTMANSLVIEGDLIISGSSILDVSPNNYSIDISGNWTDNGGGFGERSSLVTFDGTADQTITGEETFFNMAFSNVSGNLILLNDITVGNNLLMAGANINAGLNILTIGFGASDIGSLSYVSGIVTGKVERWINSYGNSLFPVGIDGSYNPAQLYINLLNSAGSVTGEFIAGDPGAAGLPLLDNTTDINYQFTDGYWNFTADNGFDVANYGISLNASNFTSYPLNLNTRVLKRTDNLNWTFDGDHVTAVPPGVFRDDLVNGISNQSTQFGLGFACAPYTITGIISDVSCYGLADGEIDITPAGGVEPYAFSWSSGQFTEDITGLTAGDYSVVVTDSLGCTANELFTVTQPDELSLTYVITNVECSADNDGAIDITVSGGTGPYVYSWSTIDGSGISVTDEDQAGLEEGTYTVLVTDANGCSFTENFTIIIDDVTAPVIICPGDLIASCDISEQPAYLTYADFTSAGGTATDNCAIDESSFIMLSETTDGNSCPELVTRIYQVSDVNGYTGTCSQIITVHDITAPGASDPAAINVECPADVPAPDVSVISDASDNCTAAPVVTHLNDLSDNNTCPETITRTYRITDDCGNFTDVQQVITVHDIIAPGASDPAAINVECSAEIPAPDISVVSDASDNCAAAPVVTHLNDVSDNNTCPETITRTYRITDDCGNFTDVQQVITVHDISPPIASNPAAISVECSADIPAPDVSVVSDASDNCTAAPLVTHINDISDNNTCPETITRTYRITDDCGNFTDVKQLITVHDISPPTASNPAAINVECSADIPAPDISVVSDASDNCTAAPVVNYVNDVSDNNTCPETITRTYRITDDCGNFADVQQVITIHDISPPTASNPAPVSVECFADVPAPDISVITDASDNCTVSPVITYLNDVSDNNTCPETITRTYRITDDCGNFADVQQVIVIEDLTDPVITGCPPDITVSADPGSCGAVVGWTEPAASDNCNLAAFNVSHASGSTFNIGTTTVSYTAADDCGNSVSCSFDVTVTDDETPVIITCAPDSTVSANSNCEALMPDLTGEIIVDDNCNSGITVTQVPAAATIINPGITTVVITVTDAAGNSIDCSTSVTVIDDTAPLLVTTDTTVYIGTGNVVVIDSSFVWNSLLSSDNCGITGVTIDNDTFDCSMTGANIINVTAYDAAGNSVAGSALVTVSDTIAVIADAGPDDYACMPGTYTLSNASVTNGSVLWGTTGNGTFNDPSLVNPVYTPGAADIDSVKLYMLVSPLSGCTSVGDTMTLYFEYPPLADAGNDMDVCTGTTELAITTAGYNNGTLAWSTLGDGSFDDNTVIDPVYIFGPSDTDSVSLVLTVTGSGVCGTGPARDTMKIIINVSPFADAGADDAVCASESTYSLYDASSAGGTVMWSSNGDGSFDDNSTDNPLYTFGTGDINAGVVILTMEVTGTGNCGNDSDDKLIIINELPNIIVDEHSGISCNGMADGVLRISGSGGTAPYQYSINGSPYQSAGEFPGLTAGDYDLSVIDALACIKDTVITLTEPAVFDYVLDEVIHNSCYGSDDASISISISGGTEPYVINWTGPGGFVSTEEDLAGLYPGLYSLSLTDANNCALFTLDTIVSEPPQIVITETARSDYNGFGVSCYGSTDGFIDLDINGGTGALNFNWQGPSGYSSSEEDVDDLQGGDYSLTVTDETGCTASYEITLDEPEELDIIYTVTDVSCPGVPDGSVELTPSGGVAPYIVLWDDGETSQERSSLTEGNYTVEITDANACMVQLTITVGVVGTNCLVIPGVITPGAVDGKNDVLKIRHIGLYPEAELRIFNRWGQMIYNARNLEDNMWDGTYKGKALPVDSYHYILDLGDGSAPRTGIITIIK